MKKNNQTHAVLLVLVAGYMLYIAYHLFDNLRSGVADMPQAAAIAAIALFGLAGVGILGFAWHIWRTRPTEDDVQDNDTDAKQ